MFTGIIETLGTVKNISRMTKAFSIQIETDFEKLVMGESIAVNGVCLTVCSIEGNSFTADVTPETYSRTSLSDLHSGSHVNLERAMPAEGRFGGHIVSGHIDGTAKIKACFDDGNAKWYEILAGPELLDGIVMKGSVAIDGISLTVAKVSSQSFSVSIIPHTLDATVLRNKRPGDVVNIETDVIGKYIKKFVSDRKESVYDRICKGSY